MVRAVDDLVGIVLSLFDRNVAKAYRNQRRLNADIKELHTNVQAHCRNTKDWIQLVTEFTKSMKELGDVEHWAGIMARDALILDGCLRLALAGSLTSN